MFSCRIENSKAMADVLTCLSNNSKKDQPCLIEATPEALQFVVMGKAKSTQSIVNLRADLFDEYVIKDPTEAQVEADLSIKLSLNLTTLLDCFQIFGSSSDSTIASITYSCEDAIFQLSLEEMGVLTTCELTTLYNDDSLEIEYGLFTSFRNSAEQCQIVMKSDLLREAMQELNDVIGATSVCMEVKSSSGVTLSSEGALGACEVSFPKNSDAFVSFRCEGTGARWMYPLTSLLLGMKALSVASETYIRINETGMMCIQHQVENNRGFETYVDFLMVAEETFENYQQEDELQR
jgi:hypothetical protein